MKLMIKNMVCQRCIMAVQKAVEDMGRTAEVKMGSADFKDDLSHEELEKFEKDLKNLGFEILDDRDHQLIEKVKVTVISKIAKQDLSEMRVNWSDHIAEELGEDYRGLSRLFTSMEGITIEQFIIRQRVEKAKELIKYNEHTLTEIAFMLGYSSVSHLANQFKKVSGLTPGEFRDNQDALRKPLDQV